MYRPRKIDKKLSGNRLDIDIDIDMSSSLHAAYIIHVMSYLTTNGQSMIKGYQREEMFLSPMIHPVPKVCQ